MAMTPAERMRLSRERKARGEVVCFEHLSRAERQRKWRKSNPESYKAHVKKWVVINRERHLLRKQDVLTHYGNGKCACVWCSEGRMACLSIDHIAGGGNKQRKGSLRTSDMFYRWLQKNNYPEGFQTLCMNCQFVKRFERGEHN